MKVFKFRIYHLDANGCIADIDENQERYVLATTENEAEKKLDTYRKALIKQGYADFMLCGIPLVELDNVIV